MAILDMGDSAEQPKGLLGFLQSPQALALAASLLKSSGYSQTPISFGQGVGQGLTDMQASANQGLDSAFKKTQTKNVQSEIDQRTRQMKATDDFHKWLAGLAQGQMAQSGQQQTPSQDTMPMTDANGNVQFPYRIGAQMPAQTSIGNTNPSSSGFNPVNMQMAQMLAANGDMAGAVNALQKSAKWERPFQAISPDGRPVLMQQNEYGQTRELPGLTPLRTGTSLSFNNGNLSFSQGAIGANGQPLDGVIKDPRMGPSRGGQGGTYIDTNTGQVISTDTNRQTSVDQQIISANDRIQPVIDTIVDKLPQFQHASTQLASAIQGLGNRFAGTNYKLPSDLASGNAAINTGAESLMKALNLPSTNEALEMTKKILAPQPGESPEYYKKRVGEDLRNELNLFTSQSQNRLMSGFPLNNGGGQAQLQSQVLTYDPKSRSLR